MSAQDTIAMMAAQLMAGILVKDNNLQSRDVDRECYTKYCVEKAMAIYKETSAKFQVHCRSAYDARIQQHVKD